jgi:hypothetical protein
VNPLTLTGASPALVDVHGGTTRLSGSGFTRGTQALVDNVVVSSQVLSTTAMDIAVPAGAAGPALVTVVQAGTADVSRQDILSRTDLRGPLLQAFAPLDTIGTQAVPIDTTFAVTFDEPVDQSSLAVLLSRGFVAQSASVAFSSDGRTVLITPTGGLVSAAVYSLTLSGIRDAFGNASTEIVRRFTAADVVAPEIDAIMVAGRPTPVQNGNAFARDASWAFSIVANDDSGGWSTSFFVDGVEVPRTGVSFIYTWPATTPDGTPSVLRAVAKDAANNTSELIVTVVVVDGQGPEIIITSPRKARRSRSARA